MRIIAFDPGVTTGIAWKDKGEYHTTITKNEDEIWSLLTGIPWNAVVFETFATSGRISSPGLQTVRLIGGIQAMCRHLQITTYAQAPMMRYPFVKQAKDMFPHKIVHEYAALSHLLRFEADHGTP
jgi:hypothetical protein